MQITHDSRSLTYRTPGGAQPAGTTVTLSLDVEGTPDSVHLRVWNGNEHFYEMTVSAVPCRYSVKLPLPDKPCLLWYDFWVTENGQTWGYGNALDGLGGVGAALSSSPNSYQITVYGPAFCTPDWVTGAVVYQIFPDRFARAKDDVLPESTTRRTVHASWKDTPDLVIDPDTHDNIAHDFFAGTLNGIREKLPYLSALGVTVLYLNPIFHAETNHRFDTTDWKTIDPMLGTNADFVTLSEVAARAGIRLVLDGVFSHSGDRALPFLLARSRPDSPYRSWYTFTHWPDEYKSWWGFRTLPEINKQRPEVVDAFVAAPDSIVKTWLRAGASGWRLDVADELPMSFLTELRLAAKTTKPDALILGEVWEDASHKVAYGQMRTYCLGDTLDSVMNYPLREAAITFLMGHIDGATFCRRMGSLYENYPPMFQRALLNLMGSHDRARILNVLSGLDGEDIPREERAQLAIPLPLLAVAKRRVLLMLSLITAMPGMPCLYYGDEVGMTGTADPYNRAPFPWGAGDTQQTQAFAKILSMRKEHPCLTDAPARLESPHEDIVVVHRDHVSLYVNRGRYPRKVDGITLKAYEARFVKQDTALPST